MGISGLLPLLKCIQNTKHLSELSGQTIGVDGYVWLHRGAYACAAELATGKPSHKYVDFAMHRVRLLQHHNIQPYIVFDGGPLPAKMGTENERERKRQENLTRANELAAQGKHNQAREFYVKCLDVTPEMAYQLIKALRAESVPYVVAPYEADAQLAYLERIGHIDGILTEDSDLLVFGCQNIYLKFDLASSTVVSISRADFASVASSDGSGITLRGWSDREFRAMAILSGCDYLPSIPGIGLKTAWQLLRKWKTVENVVRVIKLEGKKQIPREYLNMFYMAERCFLHQRVYDPLSEQLVHLHAIEGEWSAESDEYVGRFLEPSVAKKIAEGEVDPISLRSMRDIFPSYRPSSLKAKPLTSNHANRNHTKAKTSEKRTATIIDFFGPKPIIPAANKAKTTKLSLAALPIIAGKASGKRTLADVMDYDIAAKKSRIENVKSAKLTHSRFFHDPKGQVHSPKSQRSRPSSSEVTLEDDEIIFLSDEKENVRNGFDDNFGEDVSTLSLFACDGDGDTQDFDDIEESANVTQEDGYVSPSPDTRWDTPELSSPVRTERDDYSQQHDIDPSDWISSPPSFRKQTAHHSFTELTPERKHSSLRPNTSAPDLHSCFSDCSDAELSDSDSTPVTPPGKLCSGQQRPSAVSLTGHSPIESGDSGAHARFQAVAKGWRERWSQSDAQTAEHQRLGLLRRRETTITPDGKQRPSRPGTVPRLALSRHTTRPISGQKSRHA